MDAAERFFEGLRKALLSAEGAGPGRKGCGRPASSSRCAYVDGEIRVVLARRTERVPHHKGQVCFPGGSRDPGDSDLLATALRESQEELGIRPGDVELSARWSRFPPSRVLHPAFRRQDPAGFPVPADDFEIADIVRRAAVRLHRLLPIPRRGDDLPGEAVPCIFPGLRAPRDLGGDGGHPAAPGGNRLRPPAVWRLDSAARDIRVLHFWFCSVACFDT